MAILITGGAGYIGSHTLVELSHANYVYDNLSNLSQESLKRIEKTIGKSITFINSVIRDTQKLKEVFSSHTIDSVIHFAGLKAVGQTVEQLLEYYDNNLVGTLRLFQGMKDFEKAISKKVPYKLVYRRTGDIAKCFANPSYAKELLGWVAKKKLR